MPRQLSIVKHNVTPFSALLLTSTRWLSGPYNSLSNSITRLLKYVENFRFCLGPSVFGGWVYKRKLFVKTFKTTLVQTHLFASTRKLQTAKNVFAHPLILSRWCGMFCCKHLVCFCIIDVYHVFMKSVVEIRSRFTGWKISLITTILAVYRHKAIHYHQ